MKSYIEPGSYNAVCMRCGLWVKGTELDKEAHTGLYVCSKCYDEEQPQTRLKVPIEHTRGSRYLRDTLKHVSAPFMGYVWGYDLAYFLGGPGSWATWVFKETLTPAIYDTDYGNLTLLSGETVVSPVINTNHIMSRPIRMEINEHDEGIGTSYSLIYRYGNENWAQDATEGVGGVWITFDPEFIETATFKYIQVGISAT